MNELSASAPVTTAAPGSRYVIWLFTLATVVLAPLANFLIGLATGYDLASFALYTFIPVGTFALCALACSGFAWGSMRTIRMPDAVDLVFLMLASVGAIVMTFVFEYAWAILHYGATVEQLGGFGRFVSTQITEAQFENYSRFQDMRGTTTAGEGGFLIMLVRLAGAAAIAKIVHSNMVSRAINLS